MVAAYLAFFWITYAVLTGFYRLYKLFQMTARVDFRGPCEICGRRLAKGTVASYNGDTHMEINLCPVCLQEDLEWHREHDYYRFY